VSVSCPLSNRQPNIDYPSNDEQYGDEDQRVSVVCGPVTQFGICLPKAKVPHYLRRSNHVVILIPHSANAAIRYSRWKVPSNTSLLMNEAKITISPAPNNAFSRVNFHALVGSSRPSSPPQPDRSSGFRLRATITLSAYYPSGR
jgi:hypothetical protein